MRARTKGHNRHIKSALLLGSSMLAASAVIFPALAQDQAVESVTVTGYQASLENSINAKRQSAQLHRFQSSPKISANSPTPISPNR